MKKWSFVIAFCVSLAVASGFSAEKLSDFKAKAPEVVEKTRPAVESAVFQELQRAFEARGVVVRFLPKGAYTAKFLNAKDKKEYFLTAVPMVSYFRTPEPALAALVISDGKEFRAGWLNVSKDWRAGLLCRVETTDRKRVAEARTMEVLREPPLPVPRGGTAIAIAKNPEEDDMILILCRGLYPAEKEGQNECLAVIFYSGDLAWDKFTPPSEGKEK